MRMFMHLRQDLERVRVLTGENDVKVRSSFVCSRVKHREMIDEIMIIKR